MTPFAEEVLPYSVEDFPFADEVCRAILGVPVGAGQAAERLGSFAGSRNDRKASGLTVDESVYHRFIRDFVRPHLGEEFLIFQRCPEVRVHRRGGRPIVGPHTDGDYKHSPWEVNFWIPLTSAFGANSLWAESMPGLGDYHPFEATYGDAVRFYGSRCLHFTKDNTTEQARVSFDFRVVRVSDFARSGMPLPGTGSDCPWVIFRTHSVMGPDGVVAEHDWDVRAQIFPDAPSGWTPVEGGVFEGTVSTHSSDNKRGFGFIHCPELHAAHSKDVFFHLTQAVGCGPGDPVSFRAYVGRGGRMRAAGVQPGSLRDRVELGDFGVADASASTASQPPCGEQLAVLTASEAAPDLQLSGDTGDSARTFRPRARRPRSSSEEHRRRCEASFGSERLARKSCARCSWLGNRPRLLKTLVCRDASGACRPWIGENPDPDAPWGLGCLFCSAARKQAPHAQLPRSAFTEFTIGSGDGGELLIQPLARHGNNASRRPQRLARNDGHEAAVEAVFRMERAGGHAQASSPADIPG